MIRVWTHEARPDFEPRSASVLVSISFQLAARARSPTTTMAAHPYKKIKTARPDHFYTPDGIVAVDAAANPTPSEDPAASRGIPVFRPSMVEFADFERFMTSVEAWGMNSGIVKIIPPQEWCVISLWLRFRWSCSIPAHPHVSLSTLALTLESSPYSHGYIPYIAVAQERPVHAVQLSLGGRT